MRGGEEERPEGIDFVDTADMYSSGESEVSVGKALKGRRDDVVLATKVRFPMGGGPNRGGNYRRRIVQEAEESLRRLGTDWIDLNQIHRPDRTTDIEETPDRIDAIVPPGTDAYPPDGAWTPPPLTELPLRRRPVGERSGA